MFIITKGEENSRRLQNSSAVEGVDRVAVVVATVSGRGYMLFVIHSYFIPN